MKATNNYTTREINKNFKIKVHAVINGKKVHKLVGVSGLLAILGGSMKKLQAMVARAFACGLDKCRCALYGCGHVTFYAH